MSAPTGLFLPITTLRGLALLGLAEEETICIADDEGVETCIRLERVLYQPEAARREKAAIAQAATPEMRRSSLRVVSGPPASKQRKAYVGLVVSADGDDPGPTAA